MPTILGNVIIMLQRKLYYAHIMLNYVMAFYLWPKGQARCCKLNMADYGCMQPIKQVKTNWSCHRMCLCISFWYYNHFGYLKGANEVNSILFASCTIMLAI